RAARSNQVPARTGASCGLGRINHRGHRGKQKNQPPKCAKGTNGKRRDARLRLIIPFLLLVPFVADCFFSVSSVVNVLCGRIMLTKTQPDEIQNYLSDASYLKGGNASGVVFPETADEIAKILADATRTKTPVTVSGAGTGT